jgi:carbon monoxide dehydrogenase subunit G
MELTGSVMIPAARASVWQALNDPQVLGECIPGCEEVRQVSPDELLARVAVKLGPVRARFVGRILKSDVRENEGYRLEFEGSGGAAGFAKGSSSVTLIDRGAHTELSYSTNAAVGGKLGQIGGRLIDVSARQLADQFFQSLSRQFAQDPPAQDPDASEPPAAPGATARHQFAARSSHGGGISEAARILWFTLGVASTAVGVLIGSFLVR